MAKQRIDRLNSLLQEVISDVIRKEVSNPHVAEFVSITRVDISKDLRHAKVYISVIGETSEKSSTLSALQSAAGYIALMSSKKVVMRFFPALRFIIDDTVDKQMRIEELIKKIHTEEEARQSKIISDESEQDC